MWKCIVQIFVYRSKFEFVNARDAKERDHSIGCLLATRKHKIQLITAHQSQASNQHTQHSALVQRKKNCNVLFAHRRRRRCCFPDRTLVHWFIRNVIKNSARANNENKFTSKKIINYRLDEHTQHEFLHLLRVHWTLWNGERGSIGSNEEHKKIRQTEQQQQQQQRQK